MYQLLRSIASTVYLQKIKRFGDLQYSLCLSLYNIVSTPHMLANNAIDIQLNAIDIQLQADTKIAPLSYNASQYCIESSK